MNDGMRLPCDACPWRVANHGKRHKHGFYTKRNLQRLWNQIRRGGGVQSCHPTDPGHPDHGAKPDSKAQECGGSVILVTRELRRLAMLSGDPNHIDGKYIPAYLALSRVNKGLTTTGLMYYLLSRRMESWSAP